MATTEMTIAETLEAQGLPITRPCVTWAVIDLNTGNIIGLRLDEQAAKQAASDYKEQQGYGRISPKAWVDMGEAPDHKAAELGYHWWDTRGNYYMKILPYIVPPLT